MKIPTILCSALLALAILCVDAHAYGSSTILESETKKIQLNNPPQFTLTCKPGRGGHVYPTSSSLLLENLDGIFGNTRLNTLVYSDFPNMGDHCAQLLPDFLSQLPAELSITRTITETCWIDSTEGSSRAHKIQWQSLSARMANFGLGSGDEILSDIYVENGDCP